MPDQAWEQARALPPALPPVPLQAARSPDGSTEPDGFSATPPVRLGRQHLPAQPVVGVGNTGGDASTSRGAMGWVTKFSEGPWLI